MPVGKDYRELVGEDRELIQVCELARRDRRSIRSVLTIFASAACCLWQAREMRRSVWRRLQDSSVRAFAVKPRAFGAPRGGFGALTARRVRADRAAVGQ